MDFELITVKKEIILLSHIAAVALFTIYTIAIYTDCKWLKIFNWLTFPSVIIGWGLMLIQFGLLSSFKFLLMMLCAGLSLEIIKIWKPGDTKLMLSGCIWTTLFLGMNNAVVGFGIIIFTLIIYIIAGHVVWLKTCNWSFITYFNQLTFRTTHREVIGRMPGAWTIAGGNLIYIFVLNL